MQKITENGCAVLLADAGMVLTEDSAFGTTVRLGKGDDGSGWYEITAQEAQERMNADQEEATEADYQNALREMGVKV